MAKHSVPDPDGVEALHEAVNEIFRPLAQGLPGVFQAHMDRVALVPEASPHVLETLVKIHEYVGRRERPRPSLAVRLTPAEAGELLCLIVGNAFAHQADEHPQESWVGCADTTEMVFYACQIFTAAIDAARR